MKIVEHNESPQATDEKVSGLPGCGIAAYALLLMFLGLAGLAGMMGGFMGVLFGGGGTEKGPIPLQPGTQTAVWALEPMRTARVVAMDEVPLAFHAENHYATAACALFEDRLVRVDDGAGFVLPYSGIAAVEAEGTEAEGMVVTASGTGADGAEVTVPCSFDGYEGGSKFERQLRSEAKRAGNL